MKYSQKGSATIILLAFIVIILLGLIAFVYLKQPVQTETNQVPVATAPMQHSGSKLSSTSTLTSTSSQNTNDDAISNEYSGWKLYSNEAYNYSIKYPSNWYINTEYSNQDFSPRGPAPSMYMGGDTLFSNYSDNYMNDYRRKNGDLAQPADYFVISLSFTKIDPSLSLSAYLSNPSFKKPSMVENITLNGTPGVKNTYLNIIGIGDNTKPNQVSIDLKRGDEIIGIGYGFDDSVKSIVPTADKIINSLILKN